jgi:methionyl-tRNA formyltransferase
VPATALARPPHSPAPPARPSRLCFLRRRPRSLTSRLAELGAARLLDVLARLPAAQAAAWRQDDAAATRAPKLQPGDGLVRWDDPARCSVEALLRAWRALDATAFGLHTHVTFGRPAGAPKKVRLLELGRLPPTAAALPAAVAAVDAAPPPPGGLVFDKPTGVLAVRASDGWLALGRLHVETRAPLSAREFANGYRVGAGTGHRFELVRPAPADAGAAAVEAAGT